MKETERRIKIYRARLPKIREKIIASLLIFAVSAATMAVATFSWITLSVSPEVAGMTTTITANGNLEIALAGNNTDFAPPSEVGDSSLSILERNKTWGNLVNLSDATYGLDSLILSPARLNEGSLLTEPLSGPKYTDDGRVEQLHQQFGYTLFNTESKRFELPKKDADASYRGVRAISSTVVGEAHGDVTLRLAAAAERDRILSNVDKLIEKYEGMADKKAYMNALANIMVGYISHYMETNGSSTIQNLVSEANISSEDIANFIALYTELIECFEDLAVIYADYLNLYAWIDDSSAADGENCAANNSVKQTGESILAMTPSTAKANLQKLYPKYVADGFLQDINVFITEYNTLKSDIEHLKALYEQKYKSGGSVIWTSLVLTDENDNKITNMDELLTRLANVGDCDILLNDGTSLKVKSITGGSIAIKVRNATAAVINNGILKNFENRCGARILAENMKLSLAGYSVTVDVYTNADSNYIAAEKPNADEMIKKVSSGNIDYVAADTYGLVIDMWVRTNKPKSHLTLEGEVKYSDPINVKQEVSYTDEDGNVQTIKDAEIYLIDKTVTETITVTGQDGQPDQTLEPETYVESYEVYYRPGDTKPYRVDRPNEELTAQNVEIPNENGKTTVVESLGPRTNKTTREVIGYSGINRIWNNGEEEGYVIDPTTSTTQGTGSCYIFYADAPEAMEQIKALVKTMKIAFVNGKNGDLLAKAEMAVELSFESSGKVVVPIRVISDENSNKGLTDEDNNPVLSITELGKNEPMLISAIVYIDGDDVSNNMAFAMSDVQGSLNIQFGVYTDPNAMNDAPLMSETRVVSAEFVSGGGGDLADANHKVVYEKYVSERPEDFEVSFELSIEGAPIKADSKIKANFIRQINASQGTRQGACAFEDSDNPLKGTYTFTSPGDFILRSVMIDGIDYALEIPLIVTIPGMKIESVTGSIGGDEAYNYTHITSENSYSEKFYIRVGAAADSLPREVKGIFMNERNVSITTTYSSNDKYLWEADVNFSASGKYTMQYVIIDGVYYDIVNNNLTPIVRDINTGMRVSVYISPNDDYDTNEGRVIDFVTGDIKYKFYKTHEFTIGVEIMNNAGDMLTKFNNVDLTYSGLTAENLRWDANSERYVTKDFAVDRPGIFKFTNVIVNDSQFITSAQRAPVITAISTTPMKYIGVESAIPTSFVALSESNLFPKFGVTLQLEHAEAATAYALFKHTDPEGNVSYRIIQGEAPTTSTSDGESNRVFTVDKVDGYWELEAVKLDDVFFDTYYSAEDKIDLSELDSNTDVKEYFESKTGYLDLANVKGADALDNEWTETKVIAKLHLSFENNVSEDFGKDASGKITGDFLQTYSIPAQTLKIRDFEGKIITAADGTSLIDGVTLRYRYGDNSPNYGGYDFDPPALSYDLPMSVDNTGINYISAAQIIKYAGSYTPALQVILNDNEGTTLIYGSWQGNSLGLTLPDNTSEFKIYSVTPTVNIKSAQYASKDGGNASVSNNQVTVYYLDTPKTDCGVTTHDYRNGNVVITLSGFGKASEAKLIFKSDRSDGKVYLFEEGQQDEGTSTDAYIWSGNGDCTRYIGLWASRTGDDKKDPAGKLTVSTFELSDGTITYTVAPTPNVIINNPS